MIAAEFARFLGLPVTRRANITDIIEAVCGVCTDTRTSLICVDEIHNLNIATRAGAEASDTLKYFSERIPATFVYAGINVERAGLLSGTRGEQIAGRFTMVRTGPFARTRSGATLIAALEGSLRLHRHRPGTLPAWPLPAPAHPRDDRQPAVADPQRRDPGRHRRHREDHPPGPGRDPGRHRLAGSPSRHRRTPGEQRQCPRPALARSRSAPRPSAASQPTPTSGGSPAPTTCGPATCAATSPARRAAPGPIQPERLAALSGRTVAVLERTLTGLTRHSSQTPRTWPTAAVAPRGITGSCQAQPCSPRSAATHKTGPPIRTLAARHRVHRRMIRQALADPTPPPRKHPPQRTTALHRLREPITACSPPTPI